jgi:signal peptidase II
MNFKFLRYAFYVLSLAALDQITKVFFTRRDFFVGFMHFHLVKNFGLSFSLDFGPVVNSIIILAATIAFGYFVWPTLKITKINWGVVLVVAGASANLIDRLYFGFARDFWDLGLGFTFNLADVYIVLGLLMLVFDRGQ